MNTRKEERLVRTGIGASIVAAVAASICRVGPILAVTFGLTSLGALVKFESLRPLFATITIALLAAAFYVTYRKRPAGECAPGSICDTQGPARIQKINRTLLRLAASIAFIVLTFPRWSSWVLG